MQNHLNRILALNSLKANTEDQLKQSFYATKMVLLKNNIDQAKGYGYTILQNIITHDEWEETINQCDCYLKDLMPISLEIPYIDKLNFPINNEFIFMQHVIFHIFETIYEPNMFDYDEPPKSFNDLIYQNIINLTIQNNTIEWNFTSPIMQVLLNKWLVNTLHKTNFYHDIKTPIIDKIKLDLKTIPDCKFSVRQDGANAISISLMDSKKQILSNYYTGHGFSLLRNLQPYELTKYGYFIKELIMHMVNRCNYDDSDYMTDYHSVGFYSCLYIGNRKTNKPLKELSLRERQSEYFDRIRTTHKYDQSSNIISMDFSGNGTYQVVKFMRYLLEHPLDKYLNESVRNELEINFKDYIIYGEPLGIPHNETNIVITLQNEIMQIKCDNTDTIKEIAEDLKDDLLAPPQENKQEQEQEQANIQEETEEPTIDPNQPTSDLIPVEFMTQVFNNHKKQNKSNEEIDFQPPVKFFSITSNALWLITEIDENGTMFGLCDLGMGMPELGYVAIQELEEVNASKPFPPIELDLYWKPQGTLNEYANASRESARDSIEIIHEKALNMKDAS